MAEDTEPEPTRFRPLRPAAGYRRIAVLLVGPLLWVVGLIIVAWVVEHTDAIGIGVLIAVGSCLTSLLVLSLMRRGRLREERRYVDGR